MLLAYFFKIPSLSSLQTEIQNWGIVISAFALVVSSANLLMLHTTRLAGSAGSKERRLNSAALVTCLLLMVVLGIMRGRNTPEFLFVYNNMFLPLGVTFYAMNLFYMASASYRAFRARSVEGAFFLVAGVVVMLGNAPIMESLTNAFVGTSGWIMQVPNLAATRGIMIGSAIGTVTVGMRIILGIDRSYLGLEK
jgi:hypothetical protein